MARTLFMICVAEPKHTWDDFNNASVLTCVDGSKQAARAKLPEMVRLHPTVECFTIGRCYCGGVRLVSVTNRTFILNQEKEN